MNELRLDLNQSDFKDKMTKKSLKELKVNIYTNKIHIKHTEKK